MEYGGWGIAMEWNGRGPICEVEAGIIFGMRGGRR